MSMEVAFEQVPPHIKRFRYEDMVFAVNRKRTNFYIKTVTSDNHLHLFMKDDTCYGVITREPTATRPKRHGERFLAIDFLRPFVEALNQFIPVIEEVSKYDRRFRGHNVQLATFHKFRFDQTRGGISNFEADVEYRESKFENIDTDLFQFGVMKGWFGREIAIVMVGKGQVVVMTMKTLKKYAKRVMHELKKAGHEKLYPSGRK